MDQLTPDPTARRAALRKAARNAGVTPDDPLAPVVEAFADAFDGLYARIATLREERSKLIDQVCEQAAEPLTDDQVGRIAQRLYHGCEAWSVRLFKQVRWQSITCIALAGAGVLALGVAIGFYLGRQPSQVAVAQMHCYAQPNGQTFCGYVQPPTTK